MNEHEEAIEMAAEAGDEINEPKGEINKYLIERASDKGTHAHGTFEEAVERNQARG